MNLYFSADEKLVELDCVTLSLRSLWPLDP